MCEFDAKFTFKVFICKKVELLHVNFYRDTVANLGVLCWLYIIIWYVRKIFTIKNVKQSQV